MVMHRCEFDSRTRHHFNLKPFRRMRTQAAEEAPLERVQVGQPAREFKSHRIRHCLSSIGGIGRRSGLKIHRPYGRIGSTPISSTNNFAQFISFSSPHNLKFPVRKWPLNWNLFYFYEIKKKCKVLTSRRVLKVDDQRLRW